MHTWQQRRRWLHLLLIIGLSMSLAAPALPAAAAAPSAPAPGAPPSTPYRLGHGPQMELVSQRTRTSRTYANGDGTFTRMAYTGSVNYQDSSGAWQAIQNTLVKDATPGYAWTNAANRYAVHLPAKLSSAPVELVSGATTISFALIGAASVAAKIPSTGSTATYTYDGAGQQKGNSGFSGPNPTPPLTINYNQREQVQQISNTQQQLVPMTFTGPGESERVTNGTQSYTYSNLGLMRQSDTSGTIPTASYTRDPSGVPIAERLANGTTYYYLLDGYGSVTGLVDAPTTLAGSYQYCPTGNAPNGGALLTPTELGNLLRQYGFPFDDGNLDFFQLDGILRNSDIGRSIQPLGASSLYALVGSGNAGAGGMALTPGQPVPQLLNGGIVNGPFASAAGERLLSTSAESSGGPNLVKACAVGGVAAGAAGVVQGAIAVGLPGLVSGPFDLPATITGALVGGIAGAVSGCIGGIATEELT